MTSYREGQARISLDPDCYAVATAGRWVWERTADLDLPLSRRHDLVLLASELVHEARVDAAQPDRLLLDLHYEADVIAVSVTAAATSLLPSQHLITVLHLADEWGVDRIGQEHRRTWFTATPGPRTGASRRSLAPRIATRGRSAVRRLTMAASRP